ETQPAAATTSSTAEAGTSQPFTKSLPGSDVGGTGTDRGTSPAPGRRQLSETGDGTRRLIILGGVAMLVGAVVIAFTGRDEPGAGALALGPAALAAPVRRRKPPRGVAGWGEAVPLNHTKRELARRRAGVALRNETSYSDF
ncbi:MAG TPA: hypothetical protein VK848_12985, partial [Acidimicrobiia bacterium]|nr:hypothetical protein [Acidimicrobiia bacterium]